MADDHCTTLSAPEALERLRQLHSGNMADPDYRSWAQEMVTNPAIKGLRASDTVPGWRYIIAEDRVERDEGGGSA